MSSLLESITLLKFCLLLALLIGFLFGYFYSLLRAKEIYQPTIRELTRKIEQQVDQTDRLKQEYRDIEQKVLVYEKKLKESNQSIKNFREKVISKEGIHVELESEHYTLSEQYEEKNRILDYYENEMDEIKSACRLDSLSNLDRDRERLAKLISLKKEKLEEIKDRFDEIHIKFEDALLEKSKLKERKSLLEEKLRSKILEYTAYQKKSEKLKLERVEEYAHLKRKRKLTLERIKNYKDKIEVLRVTQG